MNIKSCLVRVYVAIAFAIVLLSMSFTSALASTELRQASDGPLIPAMTSNTTPSGSVTRSGIYSSSYEAWKAFDGTTNSLWLSNMYTSSVWIGYEWGGGALKVVNSYQIEYANGSCCEQRGPKNWTLQGWNGSVWVTVDTVTNQTGWYATSSRTFTVDAPGAYSRYQLNITADNYNNPTYPVTLVSIAEIQLYGVQQAAYYLRLDSIYCWAKHDLAGYDEPRLYVNGVRVWSHEHFDRGQTASLTHIALIPFGSNSTLPVTLQEYDDWPGSTVTIPAWGQPGEIDRTLGERSLDFVRGDFRTWYTLYYTVVYQ
jgi:hypothetical protein